MNYSIFVKKKMLMRLTLIIAAILVCTSVHAQQAKQDSLLQESGDKITVAGRAMLASLITTSVGAGSGALILGNPDGIAPQSLGIVLTSVGGAMGIISIIIGATSLINGGQDLQEIKLADSRRSSLSLSASRNGAGLTLEF